MRERAPRRPISENTRRAQELLVAGLGTGLGVPASGNVTR